MSLFNSGIRPAVDQWLLEKSKEVRSYGNYWSASSAGYCMRRNIFERLKVPHVAEDARKQRVFTSGNIFHKWMQEITKEAGLSIAQELELQDESLMIRGHIDDLVLLPPTQEDGLHAKQRLILYDFKTQNSRAFSYKRPDMSYYHKMQLGTYMHMLRPKVRYPYDMASPFANQPKEVREIMINQSLTEGRILKISKDDLRMTEEQLLWSPELEKEVIDYWTELNKWWKTKKMPPCTCADHEGGFLANEKYNPYFFDGEPCSIKYYEKWKEKQDDSAN